MEYKVRVSRVVALEMLADDEARLVTASRGDPTVPAAIVEVVGLVADLMTIVIGAASIPTLVRSLRRQAVAKATASADKDPVSGIQFRVTIRSDHLISVRGDAPEDVAAASQILENLLRDRASNG